MNRAARGQPRWRPISALGLIGSVIDEGLAGAEAQFGLLLEAKHGPHILDDHTVERVVRVFGDTHDDLWVFEEQLARWSKAPLTSRQRAEVDRLILQQRAMRDVVEDILALAEELRRTTIEAVLAKSDFDLGLEAVFGGRIIVAPRPAPEPPSARAREAARTQRLMLPDGVSLAKGFGLSGTPYYAITHTVLGPVGRIVVRAADAGRTRLDAEVAGAPSDPAFGRRRDLVGQVCKELERVRSWIGNATVTGADPERAGGDGTRHPQANT
ncbi:MAG: hypothetical protein ACRDY5_02415 [Acidimicrobiales bacterium]